MICSPNRSVQELKIIDCVMSTTVQIPFYRITGLMPKAISGLIFYKLHLCQNPPKIMTFFTLEYLLVNYWTTDTNHMHLLARVFSRMLSGVKIKTKKTKMLRLRL